MRAPAVVAIGVRQRVVAFEAPAHEKRALRTMERAVQRELVALDAQKAETSTPRKWSQASVSISSQQVYRLVAYLLTEEGSVNHRHDHRELVHAIGELVSRSDARQQQPTRFETNALRRQSSAEAAWMHHQDSTCDYTIAPMSNTNASRTSGDKTEYTGLLVLLSYRPDPILPFCWPSARRAVRFVNAVVSLVTANAFISTLGGGHFLCKHLDQAKLMAKIQIAVSQGLQDPILESKCRVNLAYGAMQGGRFRRAYRIIQREEDVAKQLESDELEKICHAAKVYLIKTYRLHKEYLRNVAELAKNDRLHDNFYRQRIVRAAK